MMTMIDEIWALPDDDDDDDDAVTRAPQEGYSIRPPRDPPPVIAGPCTAAAVACPRSVRR